MRIKAVSFDVAGTLIEPWPSVGHIYAEVGEAHGLGRLDPSRLDGAFLGAWKTKGSFVYSRDAWFDLVSKIFSAVVPTQIDQLLFDALWGRFESPDVWRIFPEVGSTLDALKARGLRLAIVSNWDERLVPLLRNLGLIGYFEQILVSAEVGFHKPDREIFYELTRRMGMGAETILHVGDSEEEDYKGATRAGLKAMRVEGGSIGAVLSLLDSQNDRL